MTDVVEAAKQACARCDWATAFDLLTSDDATDLAAEDLWRLAEAAWWLGRIDECLDAYTQAHKKFLADGRTADAAMAAFYLALHSSLRGDDNRGNSWSSLHPAARRDARMRCARLPAVPGGLCGFGIWRHSVRAGGCHADASTR